MKPVNLLAFGLLSSTLLAVAACGGKSSSGGGGKKHRGGGGDGDKQIAFSGQLALETGFLDRFAALRPERLFAFLTAPVVDEVWAFPASISSSTYSSDNIVKGTLNSDNSFSINIPNSSDYVVVLVNSQATGDTAVEGKLNQIVGFAGFDATNNELIRMPVEQATDNSVSLGIVTVDSAGNAISDKTLDDAATEFDSGKNALTEYSRTNDVLKSVKNAYANNTNGIYYSFDPVFMFRALQSEIFGADFSDPAKSRYTGYLVFINSNDPTFLFDSVCNKTTTVELVPPAAIQKVENATSVTELNNEATMTSQSATSCGGGELYVQGAAGAQVRNMNWGASTGYTGATSTGIWKLKLNNTVKAAFDLAAVSPVDANTGKPVVYIPVIRATKNSNNYITKVEMKLKTYNPTTSTWDDPADLTTLKQVVTNPNIALTQYSGTSRAYPAANSGTPLEFDANGVVTLSITGENWSLKDEGGDYTADSIDVSWNISGMNYRMEIRPYLPATMQ